MTSDTYKGWTISPARWPEPWTATGPNYDAWWCCQEDGWDDNGQTVSAATREDLLIEIDFWIEEMQP